MVPWDIDGQDGADFSLMDVVFSTTGTANANYVYGFNFIAPFADFTGGNPTGTLNGYAIGITTNYGPPFMRKEQTATQSELKLSRI